MPARMRSAVDEGELVVYEQLNGVLHRAVQRISANATCTRTLDRCAPRSPATTCSDSAPPAAQPRNWHQNCRHLASKETAGAWGRASST